MSITGSFDRKSHVARFEVAGTLTLGEMTKAIDAVMKELERDRGFDVLSDHRGLESPATVAQLESLVEHLRRYGQPVHGQRWAIVTRTTASFGMMRMLSVLAEGIPMQVSVFQDPVEAERWLAEPRLAQG